MQKTTTAGTKENSRQSSAYSHQFLPATDDWRLFLEQGLEPGIVTQRFPNRIQAKRPISIA